MTRATQRPRKLTDLTTATGHVTFTHHDGPTILVYQLLGYAVIDDATQTADTGADSGLRVEPLVQAPGQGIRTATHSLPAGRWSWQVTATDRTLTADELFGMAERLTEEAADRQQTARAHQDRTRP